MVVHGYPAVEIPPAAERSPPPGVVTYGNISTKYTFIDSILTFIWISIDTEPVSLYNRQRTGSYTNLYRLDERESDLESNDVLPEHTIKVEPSPSNGDLKSENKESHLYSNIGHSGYMNHNLDLDPVVLTGN